MTEIDLVDWTIQEAQHLKAERHGPINVNDKSSLDKLLAVLEREPAVRTYPDDPAALIASISTTVEEPVARPSSAIVADTKPITGFDLPAVAPAVSPISAETLTAEPKSALLMAIVEPNIYTARADRDRAVALRWVLRDIKNNRLKWSPVDGDDLRILIEMGLVEMRDGAPMLTNAGVSAIV
jgi:predicted component of type VI protein secretion system